MSAEMYSSSGGQMVPRFKSPSDGVVVTGNRWRLATQSSDEWELAGSTIRHLKRGDAYDVAETTIREQSGEELRITFGAASIYPTYGSESDGMQLEGSTWKPASSGCQFPGDGWEVEGEIALPIQAFIVSGRQ